MKTSCRMTQYFGQVVKDDDGKLKQGEDYIVLTNMYNTPRLGMITRWKDGMLHCDEGFPAVEFTDTHMEWWINGQLHSTTTPQGERRPAILADYFAKEEYWTNGTRVSK